MPFTSKISIPILLFGLDLLNSSNCLVKGYIAEEVLPEPIVPVIRKFWYKPDSGIEINSFLEFSPIISDRSFLLVFDLVVLGYFLIKIFSNFLINLKIIFLKIKWDRIKCVINVVIIKVNFIIFQSSGVSEQISNGCIP